MGAREYWSTSWNRLDAVIVITSVAGVFVDDTNFGMARIFRVLRITRILRLIQSMKPLRLMIDTLMKALPTVMNVGGMTVLYFFVFAVLGVSQFGKVNQHQVCLDEHANFSNFGYAMVTLVRMVTGEAWNCIMYDAMVQEPDCDDENNPNNDYGCGSLWAPLYFFAFIIGGNFIMINLFLAIVLENYNNARKKDAEEITARDILVFQELWNKYDRGGTGLLHTNKFEDFVRRVDPPLGLPRNSFGHIKRSDLYKLNVPLIGEYVHYHDVLQALSCQAYNVNFEELNEKVQRNVMKQLRGHRKKSVVKLQERQDDDENDPCSEVVPAAEGQFRIPSVQTLGELVWGQPVQARAPDQARDSSPPKPKQIVPVVEEGAKEEANGAARESGINQEPEPESYTSDHVIATSFLQHSVREFLFRKRLVKYIQLQMLQDELDASQELSKTLLDILRQKQLKMDEETDENSDVKSQMLRSLSREVQAGGLAPVQATDVPSIVPDPVLYVASLRNMHSM
ncbi:hypothetical protein CYMTET_30594 [Cymbomonas tetramitiformis]|uniref:EF-hand domain-containing protein n=1 Tax=Cymbomonas tetramitiformis TaxID=36881 RepID=A0AAE0KTS2_9CHLO|nr:hypothetical protein CYMTET_30594 [Cymbomonas tetramitiformis]